MPRDGIDRTAAEVSVRTTGVYLGIRARESLGVGYNDKVGVLFPEAGPDGEDIRVTGYLNSSGCVSIPSRLRATVRENAHDWHGASAHVEAVVEDLNDSWEGESGLLSNRWDGYDTLDANRLG